MSSKLFRTLYLNQTSSPQSIFVGRMARVARYYELLYCELLPLSSYLLIVQSFWYRQGKRFFFVQKFFKFEVCPAQFYGSSIGMTFSGLTARMFPFFSMNLICWLFVLQSMRLFFNAYRCPGLYHIRMRRLTFLVSIFLGICMFLWLGPEILRCGFGATCLYGNLFKSRNAATTGIPLCNSSGCLGTPGITSTRNIAKVMHWCPEYPPELVGPVVVMIEPISELAVAAKYTNLLSGGSWHPEDCDARQNVALIIPFRNRSAHLSKFFIAVH